ncbi:hypothetical protein HHK36_015092 [Tetracentron sinense]|uniref:Uncharacterized protein n=1 Tax=Tetracentron sinense TaxID=13715 RepID=A0A835DFV3_TETSI|nr:hypothetical protein HHK36_015092 [Tetracentron sinense]
MLSISRRLTGETSSPKMEVDTTTATKGTEIPVIEDRSTKGPEEPPGPEHVAHDRRSPPIMTDQVSQRITVTLPPNLLASHVSTEVGPIVGNSRQHPDSKRNSPPYSGHGFPSNHPSASSCDLSQHLLTTRERPQEMSMSMSISSLQDSTHILVFPFPAQGHMLPLLDLTHQLAIRGLTITILVTPKNFPTLKSLLSKHPSIQLLLLPFPNHPSIPAGVENLMDLPLSSTPAMVRAMGELYYPILHWFQTHPSPPVAILSDMYLGWTHHLATQLGVKRIVFSPLGAQTVSIWYRLWRHVPHRDELNDPYFRVSLPELPNSPTFPLYQIFPAYRDYREGDHLSDFIRESHLANIVSWGIVFNSFPELEGKYLDHLRVELGHDRVWDVGPLLPLEGPVGPIERGGPSSIPASDVMTWLDSCIDDSVVYVCFGTQIVLTRPQTEGLAAGLEGSGTRFIWCVKETHVPAGFEERVAGRGVVIKGWAPQVAILMHRAVGAYLTHCGWNSALEGLMARVQLLAWPMQADHYSNTRLLAKELGVATQIYEGLDTVPNSAELARVIADSVGKTRSQKVRVMELRRAALAGFNEDGSSYKNLDALVKDLRGLNAIGKEK